MNYNKEAKSLTFCRGSEVSQDTVLKNPSTKLQDARRINRMMCV